ncbi:hypothetical protein [Iodobacter sp.]|uniref:hypothetical protein n=1 Tax=Iodobacter sp. TaxID=1915058 RepID=UPI0025E7809F|nr:hypothetical protein [Iodobacter sp.]
MNIQQSILGKDALPTFTGVTVSGLSVLGIPLQEWVYIFTLLYLAAGIISRIIKLIKGKNEEDSSE